MTNANISALPLLLKVPEVAQQLGIARGKAYELVASGEIPSIRLGRSLRVPTAELLRWIAAQTTVKGAST